MNPEDLTLSITCPRCGVGRMKLTRATYIQLYENTLIHAPNTIAWRCDVCGQTFFDPDAVLRLDVLAGEAGPPPNLHASEPVRSAPSDAPSSPDDSSDTLRPSSTR
ncbi:MAG: YgiT-type zinc finger protein [Chloroflexi bacterium]|nr:YgiT-type zinc finger protein [Chloroflexota bacterium]